LLTNAGDDKQKKISIHSLTDLLGANI